MTFWMKRPFLLFALVVVLLGSAFFLMLPLVVGSSVSGIFPISPNDHISSWSWTGVYKDGGAKQSVVETEIGRLKYAIGKQGVSTYDTYVGLASEYELLGDGQSAYQYLAKAMKLDGSRGLAYLNMGHLMEGLGAFTTAGIAYGRAVTLEPKSPVFRDAQTAFLARHPATVK